MIFIVLLLIYLFYLIHQHYNGKNKQKKQNDKDTENQNSKIILENVNYKIYSKEFNTPKSSLNSETTIKIEPKINNKEFNELDSNKEKSLKQEGGENKIKDNLQHKHKFIFHLPHLPHFKDIKHYKMKKSHSLPSTGKNINSETLKKQKLENNSLNIKFETFRNIDNNQNFIAKANETVKTSFFI